MSNGLSEGGAVNTETTQPKYLEVSSHFLHDAINFELRYRHCMENDEGPSFWAMKSSRMKCFIDLRMGIESALKSIVCYHESNGRAGRNLVNWITNFSHHVDKLIRKAKPHLDSEFVDQYFDNIVGLKGLPVDLRYRIDAWDFSDVKEDVYCQTIGDDSWLAQMHGVLKALIRSADSELSKHDRVVGLEEIVDGIFEPRHVNPKFT